MSHPIPSAATLRRAIEITERIEKLEAELRAVLEGKATSKAAPAAKVVAEAAPARRGKRRKMSPEARARIVAAQKARWAKFNAAKGTAPAPKAVAAARPARGGKRRKMSPEARAR